MIWKVLKLEETKDKKAITRAYRDRLSEINPEEKPEEFKELRAAYEEALALAEKEEKPREEKTELELWQEELSAVYFDLKRRLDVHSWEELLSWDVCKALDTRSMTEDAILRFFSENFQVPHEVMVYLDEQYGMLEHIDELKETYPADFLEYIIVNKARNEDSFPLDMFSPGLDGKAADWYKELYNRACRADQDEVEGIFEELRNSSEKHPYGESMMLRRRVQSGDGSAVEELRMLSEKWPEDNHLAMDLMFAYRDADRMNDAERIADECLERDDGAHAAKQLKAEAAAARGDYEKAVEIITELLQELVGDTRSYSILSEQRMQWNESRIEQLKEKTANDPSDYEALFDLIWCYIDNDRYDEADALALELPEEKPDAFAYYNMKSVLANGKGRYEESLSCLNKLLETVNSMQPDGTEKTVERIGRKTEIMIRISAVQFELGERGEAMETAEEIMENGNVDLPFLFTYLSMCQKSRNYEKAVELTNIILERNPGNSGALFCKAQACYMMGVDNAAFEAVNDAISSNGSELRSYLLKLLILTRNNAFAPAVELMEFLEQNGIENEPTINYCRMVIFYEQEDDSRTQEDYDSILETAVSVAKVLEAGEYGAPDWAPNFYYIYALISADRQGFDKKYPVEPLIEILDKGLMRDPEYYPLRSYKAWLLKKGGKKEEALRIYRELEKIEEHPLSVEKNLAEIYFDDLEGHAGDALRYFDRLVEDDPENADMHYYAGICHFNMEQPAEAEQHFLDEQRLAPDDIDGYFRLVYVYLKLNRIEDAIEQGLKTIELAKKNEGNTVRFWMPLIYAYQRSGRTDEALDAVGECMARNPEWNGRRMNFDIMLQAGRLDDAQAYVKRWHAQDKTVNNSGWIFPQLKLDILRKDWSKLKFHIWNYQAIISPAEKVISERIQTISSGNVSKYCKVCEAYYQSLLKDSSVRPFDKADYAWALFVGGREADARKFAAEALEEWEKNSRRSTGMRLLYHTKKISMLSILGRIDEARQIVEEATGIPLCETCEFCTCKDLDYFVCEMEFIAGNHALAMELAQKGAEKWPDETDFIEMQCVIKAKGKK